MSNEQVRREFEAWHKEHSGISLMRHANGGDYVYADSEWQLWLSRQAEIDRLTLELAECKKDAKRQAGIDSTISYRGFGYNMRSQFGIDSLRDAIKRMEKSA